MMILIARSDGILHRLSADNVMFDDWPQAFAPVECKASCCVL